MDPKEKEAFAAKLKAGASGLTTASAIPGLGAPAAVPAVVATGLANVPEFASRLGDAGGILARSPVVRGTQPLIGAGLAVKDGLDQYNYSGVTPASIGAKASFVAGQGVDRTPPALQEMPQGPNAYGEGQLAAAPLDPNYGKDVKKAAGGGGGADGSKLKGAVDMAHGRQMNALEIDKNLAQGLGDAEELRHRRHATLEQLQAMRVRQDAIEQQEVDRRASAQNQAFLARNTQLADEIAAKKIDTRKFFKDQSTADDFSWSMSAGLGGALRALNGGSNATLDRMDRLADKEIDAQKNAIENQKSSLQQRDTIYGQMLKQTGDDRTAAMATRNLMYDAAKQEIGAAAEVLGTPEAQIKAQQNIAAIEHKQADLQAQLAEQSLKNFQAQQAAAAAAAKAAEAAAWQREKDLADMAYKRDELKIRATEAEGKLQGDKNTKAIADDKAVAAAAEALGKDGIVKNEALVNALAGKVQRDEKGNATGVKGLSRIDEFRAKVSGSPLSPLYALAPNAEDRVTQQDWERAKLVYQTEVTGSGGSDEQMKKIGAAFEGAGTGAQKANAIMLLKATLDARKQAASRGLNDEQKAIMQARIKRDSGG